MARSKAQRDEENLNDAAIERVIKHLADKGTKKAACQILNISYNVARLDKLIETYLNKKEHAAKRRAEKRGTAATLEEVTYIVTEYLKGEAIVNIGNSIYRGNTFVNSVLEQYGVPKRNSSPDYFNPPIIPEVAMCQDFKIGEKVYSARYDSLATVKAEQLSKEGQKVYRLWLDHESQQQFCYQPWWELASLEPLRQAGIKL